MTPAPTPRREPRLPTHPAEARRLARDLAYQRPAVIREALAPLIEALATAQRERDDLYRAAKAAQPAVEGYAKLAQIVAEFVGSDPDVGDSVTKARRDLGMVLASIEAPPREGGA